MSGWYISGGGAETRMFLNPTGFKTVYVHVPLRETIERLQPGLNPNKPLDVRNVTLSENISDALKYCKLEKFCIKIFCFFKFLLFLSF